MTPYVLVTIGGVAGANLRFVISAWAASRFGVALPIGTFLINASGSAVMGFFLTLVGDRFANNADARLLIATGFLGGYTTFSTFTFETGALIRRGGASIALLNLCGSAAAGIGGAALGLALANLISGRL